MKKIILLVIIMLLLCGCEKNEYIDEDQTLVVYCDKDYGVEYIRDVSLYHGGITVRLDENGNVIHCG